METCQSHPLDSIEKQQDEMTVETEPENEMMLNASFHNDKVGCNSLPEICEETSYHELRCLSNVDLNDSITPFLPVDCKEYEELINMKHQQPSFEHSYCKFYKTFAENGFGDSLENTDDQLLIEIVKEEIDLKSELEDDTSIFDSISFNIEDNEDSMTYIKITEENQFSVDDTSKYVFFKKPLDNIPEISPVIRMKDRQHRKPVGLTNYRNLITQAINSSPEKRLILTDIYKWIIEHMPTFNEKDDGWKNCIRHTLSVNERFMRIRNRANYRSSYWTVCEEGEFNTKIAAFPWASEIFKPEERKRRPKIKQVNAVQSNKSQLKPIKTKHIIHPVNNRPEIKKGGRRRGRPVIVDSERLKPHSKVIEKKKRGPNIAERGWRHVLNSTEKMKTRRQLKTIQTTECMVKDVNNKRFQTKKSVKKKNNTKMSKKNRINKTESKKYINKGKTKRKKTKIESGGVRRSSRQTVTRKTWSL